MTVNPSMHLNLSWLIPQMMTNWRYFSQKTGFCFLGKIKIFQNVVCWILYSECKASIFSRHFEIFSYFSQETWFDISCKLSPNVKFSGKNKRIINMLSAEIAQRVLTINFQQMTFWNSLIFSQETGFDFSCKLSLFSGMHKTFVTT